jgi:hypothetical protein
VRRAGLLAFASLASLAAVGCGGAVWDGFPLASTGAIRVCNRVDSAATIDRAYLELLSPSAYDEWGYVYGKDFEVVYDVPPGGCDEEDDLAPGLWEVTVHWSNGDVEFDDVEVTEGLSEITRWGPE